MTKKKMREQNKSGQKKVGQTFKLQESEKTTFFFISTLLLVN